MSQIKRLEELVRPTVEALGFELWGVEFHAQGKHSVFRVFIDHENGINVDDCAKVSRQISAVMDVEDPIRSEYRLEVSSPGMDRPLFSIDQCKAYIGEMVNLRLRLPFDGRRKFSGRLVGIEQDQLVIQDGQTEYTLPFERVEKANVVPTF